MILRNNIFSNIHIIAGIIFIIMLMFIFLPQSLRKNASEKRLEKFKQVEIYKIVNLRISKLFATYRCVDLKETKEISSILNCLNLDERDYLKEKRGYPIELKLDFTVDKEIYEFELYKDKDSEIFNIFFVDQFIIPLSGVDKGGIITNIYNKL